MCQRAPMWPSQCWGGPRGWPRSRCRRARGETCPLSSLRPTLLDQRGEQGSAASPPPPAPRTTSPPRCPSGYDRRPIGSLSATEMASYLPYSIPLYRISSVLYRTRCVLYRISSVLYREWGAISDTLSLILYTVQAKSLDTPTQSRVFLYFYYYLHCRKILKTSKLLNNTYGIR